MRVGETVYMGVRTKVVQRNQIPMYAGIDYEWLGFQAYGGAL